jgi:thiol-disulfide isomerase/thioredoxin
MRSHGTAAKIVAASLFLSTVMKKNLTLHRLSFTSLAAGAIATALSLSPLLRAADPAPTTGPTAGAPTPAPAVAAAPATQPAQTVDSLTTDIDKQIDSVKDVLGNPSILTDAAKRAEVSARVIPSLQKVVDDCNALVKADPAHKSEYIEGRAEFRTFLSLFGDSDATKALATEANSTDADQALEGKRSLMMVSWLRSADDADHQTKIVDNLEKLAKDNVKNVQLTAQIAEMSRLGCSTPELGKRLETLITDTMKNDLADRMKDQIAAAGKQNEEQAAAAKKLSELENKPLVITGKQPDGKDFTTADWKGKVILVDFWATWCPPCREELPRVKKTYEDYHAKGLEVLGVSNDQSGDDLTKFIKDDGKMPWPQLFDEAAAKAGNWNPITLGYGINGIPVMFLIDKKGVVRTVEAREKMEELIPKLLDEK